MQLPHINITTKKGTGEGENQTMNKELAEYLEQYQDNITDNKLFQAIITYLPASYQYQLILQLEENKEHLQQGNIHEARKPEGEINIEKMCITLTTKENEKIILCPLPQPHDIY